MGRLVKRLAIGPDYWVLKPESTYRSHKPIVPERERISRMCGRVLKQGSGILDYEDVESHRHERTDPNERPFITHTEIRSFADYTYLLPSIPQGKEPGLVDTFSLSRALNASMKALPISPKAE